MKHPTHISAELMATLPTLSYPEKKIIIVDTLEKLEEAVHKLNTQKLIGFDTETKPSFTKGVINKVALLQLASEDVCYLFRLHLIGLPHSLMAILANPSIIKIGIALRDDFSGLRKWNNAKPQGFIDIQQEIHKVGIQELSLQKIYAILFARRISKNQRLSNWESEELSEAQQHYAAIDAWACLDIYHEIKTYIE
ncbi:MAG: 3'-5' exonuclease domain-containing protein 2 [Paludibacteraceae bacterium]|nr:3'-5' exonuclease domain-containing protein 2 [Paludibacteraceae bacterium]MBP8781339.1 3'-5' exonuclease domain-containing protein 2 [Paludibacteraceae bacterium]NLK92929.1 3'-5' exonuclease domain-containing protein 2 [Bacteroidales bacterium]HNZ84824.1 3'-5' exonuclease [Paludibacteraceae bacterium]HOH74562.1 3'-5' exonuclease [Paludibacteraceae bacterium]